MRTCNYIMPSRPPNIQVTCSHLLLGRLAFSKHVTLTTCDTSHEDLVAEPVLLPPCGCSWEGRAQQQVVALDNDNLVAGADCDVALERVTHAMVKRRHAHLACTQHELCPSGADETRLACDWPTRRPPWKRDTNGHARHVFLHVLCVTLCSVRQHVLTMLVPRAALSVLEALPDAPAGAQVRFEMALRAHPRSPFEGARWRAAGCAAPCWRAQPSQMGGGAPSAWCRTARRQARKAAASNVQGAPRRACAAAGSGIASSSRL